jgi:hypothetical protein
MPLSVICLEVCGSRNLYAVGVFVTVTVAIVHPCFPHIIVASSSSPSLSTILTIEVAGGIGAAAGVAVLYVGAATKHEQAESNLSPSLLQDDRIAGMSFDFTAVGTEPIISGAQKADAAVGCACKPVRQESVVLLF